MIKLLRAAACAVLFACALVPPAALAQPFQAFALSGHQTLSAGAASSRIPLPTGDNTILVRNLGAVAAHIALGGADVTATLSGFQLRPGESVAFAAKATTTHIAAITAAGTATLSVATGTGAPEMSIPGSGGGGGGGGAVTVADGADVTQGSTADAAWSGSGGATLVSAAKSIRNVLAEIRDATAPVPVTASSLPLPAGAATAARQAAPGAPGAPSEEVITIQGAASMTPIVIAGSAAHATPSSGFPVKMAGVYNSTAPTLSNNQVGELQMDAVGATYVHATVGQAANSDGQTNSMGFVTVGSSRNQRLLGVAISGYNGTGWDRIRADVTGLATQPYGLPSARWSYAAAAGGIVNSTTAVTLKTAAGAGVRNCIASLDLAHDALGGATELVVRDGAGGAVLFRTKLQTTANPGRTVTFPAAVCGSPNTLLEAATLTAVTGGVYVNATGNTSP